MPVSNVAANSPATSAWANSVADAITELEGVLFPNVYGELEVAWDDITGKPSTYPATMAVAVQAHNAYGLGTLVGTTGRASDEGHRHGTPALPTPTQVGAWAKGSSGGGAAGTTVYVGTTAPAAPVEGDVWIKG